MRDGRVGVEDHRAGQDTKALPGREETGLISHLESMWMGVWQGNPKRNEGPAARQRTVP